MTPSGGWWPNGRPLVVGGQLARDVERVVRVEVGEGRDGCLGDEPAKSLPHYPHLLALLGHTLARLYLFGLIQGIRHTDPDLTVLLHITVAPLYANALGVHGISYYLLCPH
jgi:hypothetical protein